MPVHKNNIIIFQDIDGCITPNIDLEGRAPHPQLEALKQEVQAVRDAGGISVLSTGRPYGLIKADSMMDNYPADYIITNSGVEIMERQPDSSYKPFDAYVDYLMTPNDPAKLAFDTKLFEQKFAGHPDFEFQPVEKVAGERLGLYFASSGDTPEQVNADEATIKQLVKDIIGAEYDYQVVPSLDPHHGKWNVDIMPSKANKLGAATWLIEHLQEKGVQLDAAIVWGDSGNDRPAMDPALYEERGLIPAFIAPGNARPELREYLESLGKEGIATFVPAEKTPESEMAGGLIQGLQQVLPQIADTLSASEGLRPTAQGLQSLQQGA